MCVNSDQISNPEKSSRTALEAKKPAGFHCVFRRWHMTFVSKAVLLISLAIAIQGESCCVGFSGEGTNIACETTYNDNFFVQYNCVGPSILGILSYWEKCNPTIATGGIALIIVGAVLFLALIGCCCCCYCRDKQVIYVSSPQTAGYTPVPNAYVVNAHPPE
eukprot:Phypoly_transcript_16177.p1 GENE.Phypoly_transcript_16177~~Phypoly_transcript_16177.p1  ORF type:complete len:162 (+),score=10.45 Phypoly_transcript_16177:378-863(+)